MMRTLRRRGRSFENKGALFQPPDAEECCYLAYAGLQTNAEFSPLPLNKRKLLLHCSNFLFIKLLLVLLLLHKPHCIRLLTQHSTAISSHSLVNILNLNIGMDFIEQFLSESETDTSSGFVAESITGITSQDLWDSLLTQVPLTPWENQCKAENMYPLEGFHGTVWETPDWNELEANISDSRSCWKFADLKDEYLGESSVHGSELSTTSSDTSHYSEIEEVNQQNALMRTESYTQENLWMSVDNQSLNVTSHSSIKGDNASVIDSTYEGDGILRKRPIMSKLLFKANPLKPKATNIRESIYTPSMRELFRYLWNFSS
ncbi:hypothetical protein KP509_24G019200 [Ceratopteris richardii]|uniref:Uncharacterized protein n=1 Tax=Ceratopteris richardii TaxID=49495 RepID=A0A8T2RVL8_CERRI|nr:hypothetical protein KP509_24G019200 [Ceratopteris richardii]